MDILTLVLVLVIIGLGVGLITLWLDLKRTRAVQIVETTPDPESVSTSNPPRPIKIRLKRATFADGTELEVDFSHRDILTDAEVQALHPEATLISIQEITKITRIEKH